MERELEEEVNAIYCILSSVPYSDYIHVIFTLSKAIVSDTVMSIENKPMCVSTLHVFIHIHIYSVLQMKMPKTLT